MASNFWTFLLVGVQIVVQATEGLEDPYRNSFISPNSASDSPPDDIASAEWTSNPPSNTATKVSFSSIVDEKQVNNDEEKSESDPMLSRTAYKNIEEALDSNDVELSGRMEGQIRPSKTDKLSAAADNAIPTTAVSGEAPGAPQPKSLPLLPEPHISPTATTTPDFATRLSHPPPFPMDRGRQANPDIQDIITGIVKLLNGNVNVQANTAPAMGRPLRPLSTRINNRGPPRITDMPALPPDFDVPAPLPPPVIGQMPPPLSTTRLPTPYPFDVPSHSNMSPVRPYDSKPSHSSKRPGFYRPVTIPPWNRRRPPNRRPSIPHPYKPLPPMSSEHISLTSERPNEDVLTLDLGSHLAPSGDAFSHEQIDANQEQEIPLDDKEGNHSEHVQQSEQLGHSEAPELSTDGILENSEVDKETADFEKNKEKVTNPDKHTVKTTLVTPTFNTAPKSDEVSILDKPTTTLPDNSTDNSTTSVVSEAQAPTQNQSSVSIEPTSATKELEATPMVNVSLSESSNETISVETTTPVLESSMLEVLSTLKEELLSNGTSTLVGTETEKLPDISSTTVENVSTTTGVATSASSITSTASSSQNSTHNQSAPMNFPYFPYRPRPGIVLDDTEYKPGGIHRQPILTRPPVGQIGDIFDITVSAIQGPGGASSGQGKPYIIPVDIESVHNQPDVITSSTGSEGFVSIDGKRTYLNLFGDGAPSTTHGVVKPTAPLHNQVTGTGYAVVDAEKPTKQNLGGVKPTQRRPMYGRPTRPSQPPVRIDTCIVGDDSTCDASQHEICRTESGVSACHCRPGTARRRRRDPCRRVVAVAVQLRVDRLYDRRVAWVDELADPRSDSHRQLAYEAERALESAMSMTPFSDEFLAAKVTAIYRSTAPLSSGVFVNATLELDETADTARPAVRTDIQRHLLGVIQRRGNNVGESAIWVDGPAGAVSSLQDLDECSSPELHDCHSLAKCINVFGGFKCECGEGYRDPWADNKHRAGKQCEQCSPAHCNNRGECKYQNGQEVCICTGSYYGSQCEVDGEVLGVAIGASVAAIIIIGLTLVCLVMWSRRWSREHKAAVGSPVFGYMATASNTVKTPVVGAPPYQLTLEDRLRWAQIADVMAQANHYAPEPGLTAPTRPSSALFGYPSLQMTGTLQHHGTLPPVPLPRLNIQAQLANRAASIHGMKPLDNSSSSEEEDKVDLLGRSFQVPRPKSRSNASIAVSNY
ncbi:unnamed protein product [Acanthoscelides obtectus]|uniref:EGF-like domain-containing protein n=1 Tax=Acanthoscelides obtectus TaxID=200917 RepID=A0A9P0NU58_ACAOB|nr:unnamed protein product [Acanthoscelides obtectus]CAK1665745.1 Transmembrane matrix receptor MUP-4 [Acanthoscelides obtectus]